MYDCNIEFFQTLSSIRAKRWSQRCSPSPPPRLEMDASLSSVHACKSRPHVAAKAGAPYARLGSIFSCVLLFSDLENL
jgi:hypothetical protein